MYHRFTQDQTTRLLRIAYAVLRERDCTPDESIEYIEEAIASAGKPQSTEGGRSVYEFAEGVRRLRVRRNELLGSGSFRDPTWDMMLDLLVAYADEREMCVTSLCAGSGVPLTTALRHIEKMERASLIERNVDPQDHRRTLVKLTPDAASRLEKVVAAMQNCA